MILTLVSIAVIVAAGYLVLKRYQPHAVLFIAGLFLLTLSVIAGQRELLTAGAESTGWIGFDIFAVIREIMAGRVGEIGLIIMTAGGFAEYMEYTGAAETMVRLAIKPLAKLRHNYVILATVYVLGQILHVAVPSAAGLAMLMLITIYPVLIRLGISPASAAAVLGTCAGLDIGPASGVTNVGSEIVGMNVTLYFVHYQIPVSVLTILTVALLHFFVQRFFDRRDERKGKLRIPPQEDQTDLKNTPHFYAFLPVFPLVLLLIFSRLFFETISLDVVTAMMISLFVSMLLDGFHTRDLKKTFAGIMVFFKGMGKIFATIVTLIFAAETFATGLKSIGFIDTLLGTADSFGLPAFSMLVLLVLIIGVTALVTGSGNAAFFSFAHLAPDIAARLGLKAIALIVPMQLVSGMFRSFSPVAGVIIAVAGAAELSTFEVVKRAVIPMAGGIIVLVIASWYLLV